MRYDCEYLFGFLEQRTTSKGLWLLLLLLLLLLLPPNDVVDVYNWRLLG